MLYCLSQEHILNIKNKFVGLFFIESEQMIVMHSSFVIIVLGLNLAAATPAEEQYRNFSSVFPIVCIPDGCIEGRAMNGYLIDEFQAFFNIPYAEPPIGDLRFAVS